MLKFLMMSEFEKDIEHCLVILNLGGTILYPTDTVWGIGCDATNNEAVQKVYNLKDRPSKKSLIVLLADEKDILESELHAIAIIGKVAAQNAANAAIGVLQKAVDAVIKI